MITHLYHVYAGGQWERIVEDHLALIEKLPFDLELKVGIVGPRFQRKRVVKHLPTGTEILAEADTGYEQVTLGAWSWEDRSELVVYAHTKGAANNHDLNRRWRADLELLTFGAGPATASRQALQENKIDVVAPHWLEQSVTGVLPPGCAGFSPGNYWWARGDYLARLPEPHDPENRYAAEEWIGMGAPRVATTDPLPWDPRRWAA